MLALGTMGAGLAYWNETLEITGTVATGNLDVEFSHQKSNDDGIQQDPNERGTWTFPDLMDPASWVWVGDRYAYHVASTTCDLVVDETGGPEDGDVQTMTITIENAYPSYYGNVAFTIDNIGTIPAHVESIKLVEVSNDTAGIVLPVDVALVACTTYYVDADSGMVTLVTSPQGPADFSIHLSELEVCQVIPVEGALPGDISIHVEPGAEELTTYDFVIDIVVTQFNAP